MSFLNRAFARSPAPPEQIPEARSTLSISDPHIFELLGAQPTTAGVVVSETSVLGLSAVFRAVSLIAGSIATLPLRSLRVSDGISQPVPSWLDSPWGDLTRFELIETTLAHMLLWGNAYWAHVYGGAGQLIGVTPIHPSAVGIDQDSRTGVKTYKVSLADGTSRAFVDAAQAGANTPFVMTHFKGLSVDGVRGLSPIQLARNGAFGTAIAADRSAAALFGNGPSVTAIASLDAQTSAEDAKELAVQLDRGLTGPANAGRIGYINRNVQIHQLTMSNEDSQWIQARNYQTGDIARLYGVPSHLIGLEDKNSSWGTGISEMSRGFARYTLMQWTSRVEDRLSRLLPADQRAEFDYAGFIQPDPVAEITSLVAQVDAGLITVNEARRIRNLAPIEGGDMLRTGQPVSAA